MFTSKHKVNRHKHKPLHKHRTTLHPLLTPRRPVFGFSGKSEPKKESRQSQKQRVRDHEPLKKGEESEYDGAEPRAEGYSEEYSDDALADPSLARDIDDVDEVPPLPRNLARITEDKSVNVKLTPQVLDAIGSLIKIPDERVSSPRTDLVYNQQHGVHPAALFFLYPSPYLTEKYYYRGLDDNTIHPRYSYNDQRDGLLEHIRGVHYTPQLGQSHVLSQGKLELFKPITFADDLQYVIQAPQSNFVERNIKHRDRLQFDEKGNVIDVYHNPADKYNQYFTSPEHVQIQTFNGELCVDFQLEHVFYDNMNHILVNKKEQKNRQQLEFEYEGYLHHKAEQMNDTIQEYNLKRKIEKDYIKSHNIDREDKEYQRFLDFKKVHALQTELKSIGGLRPRRQKYWDYTVNSIKITRDDVHRYVRYSNNNNKLLYSDRYAKFHGHNGTLIPTELLATIALDQVAEFASKFVPNEPQIFQDVRYEAQLAQMEHLKAEILDEKQEEFLKYHRVRGIRRRAKQNSRYEEMRIDLQQKLDEVRAGHQNRKEKGEALGFFGKLRATRNVTDYQDQLAKLPLPEDIDVSDSDPDSEFENWQTLEDVTLNDEEIEMIKERVTAPHFRNVFHHPRKLVFRNFCPLEFPTQHVDDGPVGLASKILKGSDQDTATVNFYARVLEDNFDYKHYEALLSNAQEEFRAEVERAKTGLIREEDLDLSRMVAFEDVCRDTPLEIEVWFDIPDKLTPEQIDREIRKEPDATMRPTPGTKCFYGIITYDAPYMFNFMDLDEDQMKKLFAFRQGITLRQ